VLLLALARIGAGLWCEQSLQRSHAFAGAVSEEQQCPKVRAGGPEKRHRSVHGRGPRRSRPDQCHQRRHWQVLRGQRETGQSAQQSQQMLASEGLPAATRAPGRCAVRWRCRPGRQRCCPVTLTAAAAAVVVEGRSLQRRRRLCCAAPEIRQSPLPLRTTAAPVPTPIEIKAA
jgi:hypothetical protein